MSSVEFGNRMYNLAAQHVAKQARDMLQ